jgi:ribosome-binding ATPase YchF (GTP1/OBG family)
LYNYSGEEPNLPAELESRNFILLDLKEEMELSELTENEIEELGLKPKINQLIKKSFELLNLAVFYTFNEKEIRAWEVKKGTKAPQAGGKIHSDFEEKFIRAEVIQWDNLLKMGSWQKAREKGELRIEGKDYVVQDGDVIYFLI